MKTCEEQFMLLKHFNVKLVWLSDFGLEDQLSPHRFSSTSCAKKFPEILLQQKASREDLPTSFGTHSQLAVAEYIIVSVLKTKLCVLFFILIVYAFQMFLY